MKPAPFDYSRPASLGDALACLHDAGEDAAVLAGGQSLMPMMNFRMATPRHLVDLNDIKDLRGITQDAGVLRIGAMTRYADLAAAREIAAHAPLILRALPHIAHPAIRNRGTIGGSVALADPAAEMPAVLLALNATIQLVSRDGKRHVPADDFFLGLYETALRPGELVTSIEIPFAEQRVGFAEVARRHGDYAMAGVAVSLADVPRLAFFAVADRPVRAKAAEDKLAADPADLDGAIAALAALDFARDLNGGVDMKRHLAGVVLRRAMQELA